MCNRFKDQVIEQVSNYAQNAHIENLKEVIEHKSAKKKKYKKALQSEQHRLEMHRMKISNIVVCVNKLIGETSFIFYCHNDTCDFAEIRPLNQKSNIVKCSLCKSVVCEKCLDLKSLYYYVNRTPDIKLDRMTVLKGCSLLCNSCSMFIPYNTSRKITIKDHITFDMSLINTDQHQHYSEFYEWANYEVIIWNKGLADF